MMAAGIDIIEISRVQNTLNKFGDRFLKRVYTEPEITLYHGRVQDLAARFAAKEAVMKALGTGAKGVGWKDIEILPNHRGKPLAYLHGRGKKRANELGIKDLEVSLSHSKELATAIAIATTHNESQENREESRDLLLSLLKSNSSD